MPPRDGFRLFTKRPGAPITIGIRAGGREVRLATGERDERRAAAIGRRVVDLMAERAAGVPLGESARRWVQAAPAPVRRFLARHRVVDAGLLEVLTIERAVESFNQYQEGRGVGDEHRKRCRADILRMSRAAGWATVRDISAPAVEVYVRTLPAGAARQNRVQASIRAMTRWAWRSGALADDPLRVLRPRREADDRRRRRRIPTPEETSLILEAARTGPALATITGPDRVALYRVAMNTGLRRSELASLTPRSFVVEDPENAAVAIRAEHSKRRRDDEVPIAPAFAVELREWLRGKDPAAPLWPALKWANTAKMLHADMKRARERWLIESPPSIREAREKSDTLLPVNHAEEVLDFHSWRLAAVSAWCAAGATPKELMDLARHSSAALSLAVYTRLRLGDTRRIVDRVAEQQRPEQLERRATG